MTRLTSAIKTDIRIQIRNRLYIIGPVVSAILGFLVAQVSGTGDLARAIPVIVILAVGGAGFLYVGGLIIFEKDEGTLNAVIVSPLRTSEYLLSKVVTLTFLALLESLVLVGVVLFLISRTQLLEPINMPLLLMGIAIVASAYTLAGIILFVRFNSVTDALVPLFAVGGMLQIPFLYFLDLVKSPLFLIVPTSAPAMLMQGGFRPLLTWEWVYGVSYSATVLVVLAYWAYTSFRAQIIMKAG